MSSVLIQVLVAALGLPQASRLPVEETWWDLGLIGKVVPQLESENRLGQYSWWIPEATFHVEEGASELGLRIRADIPYGHFHEIELRLTDRQIRARVRNDDRPVTEVVGVSCLHTDGRTSVIDFELYPVREGVPFPYFGRAELGPAGVAMAKELAERNVTESSPLASRKAIALGKSGECRGWTDISGRRQGVWTWRENGVKRCEEAWTDGRPHGRWASWDAQGRLIAEYSYRDGLMHGESYQWYENGEIRGLGRYIDGHARGLRVIFHPSGAKKREGSFEGGTWKSWDEEGQLVEERPLSGSMEWSATPEARKAQAQFLEEVSRLRTRE